MHLVSNQGRYDRMTDVFKILNIRHESQKNFGSPTRKWDPRDSTKLCLKYDWA